MVADLPALNVDASVQVAHALSTHAVRTEFDYYTAVDDENPGGPGAGMIGTVGFNSSTLYRYAALACPNCATTSATDEARPDRRTVHRHVHPLHAHGAPELLRPPHPAQPGAVTVRADQPVNLVSAFEKPLLPEEEGEGLAADSAVRLAVEYDRATRRWGDTPAHVTVCHTFDPDQHTGERLTAILGANTTFPTLIADLHAALAGQIKQAR